MVFGEVTVHISVAVFNSNNCHKDFSMTRMAKPHTLSNV